MLPRAIAPRGIATPFDSLTSRTTRAVTGWRRWHDFVLSGVSRRSHRTVPGGRVAPGRGEPAREASDAVAATLATLANPSSAARRARAIARLERLQSPPRRRSATASGE